jgi:mannose-6-phosphate isomerase-like protein (cupin superfamily)
VVDWPNFRSGQLVDGRCIKESTAMSDDSQQGPYEKFVVRPQLLEHGKQSTNLLKNNALTLAVHVVSEGGEDSLHKHPGSDAVWYVLSGEASFYGEGDKLIAKLGKNEGLHIPRDSPYWFESSGKDNLVILRFGARVDPVLDESKVHLTERNYVLKTNPDGSTRQDDTRILEGAFFEG